MFPPLIKVKNIILDILFPSICLNCQKFLDDRNKLICESCLSLIKFNNTLFCPVCRARLADNKRICHHKTLTYTDLTRTNANKKQRVFSYLLAAAGNYNDPVLQNLIHYFKYKYFKNLTPVLEKILTKYLDNLSLVISHLSFVIVPIPLHPQRERKRGFNQAKLIAEIVAQYFALPLIDGLKRVKNNKPQVDLKNNEDRIKNIQGCFKIKNSELIRGKNIILIDDVFTSGATINEAAKVLKENGAKKIIALVLAKA